ncbi:MAG: phage protease [Planctomycetota bacterium]
MNSLELVTLKSRDLESLKDSANQPLPEIRIFQWGKVDAGHASYVFDDEASEMVMKNFSLRKRALHIDYEHQSVDGQNNRPDGLAPAAGWIEPGSLFVKRNDGLYARVKWTQRAKELILADEYRYLSPEFSARKKDGKVVELRSVGVVNRPATFYDPDRLAAKEISNMGDLMTAVLKDPTQSASMEEKLLHLAGKCGADKGADALTILTAAEKRIEANEGAAETLKLVCAFLDLPTDTTNENTVRSKLKELRPATEVASLTAKVSVLEQQHKQTKFETLLAKARTENKIGCKDERKEKYLKDLVFAAREDAIKSAEDFIDMLPSMVASGQITPTSNERPKNDRATAILTAKDEYRSGEETLGTLTSVENFVNLRLEHFPLLCSVISVFLE